MAQVGQRAYTNTKRIGHGVKRVTRNRELIEEYLRITGLVRNCGLFVKQRVLNVDIQLKGRWKSESVTAIA